MQSEGGEEARKPQRFRAGGVTVGVLGLVVVAVVLVVGTVDDRGDFPAWAYPCGLAVAVVIWAVMIRPALVLGEDEMELRNVFHSRWIPYAEVVEVRVAQVTIVHTEDGRYVGSGFGRSRTAIRRDGKHVAGTTDGRPRAEKVSAGQLVEDLLQRRVRAAQEQQTLAAGADVDGTPTASRVRRVWSWPVLVLLAVSVAATVVLALVG
ncbi:hypothetical protein JK386_05800 [Nocardioides sp. zg-536]|uniref:PH domain-containing protein n=1 Tax=Nocardioides faecalis TaxID=2803858 RepID=A0A938Y3N6_9ACTN|nr:hypothetical protein [Nocardioides faecalis]MBM9459408.1 hypothetical protein [Nocardioides faecalis]QVI59484.1 hypothetical protein KG111_03715 [Nocardioides faecalis]